MSAKEDQIVEYKPDYSRCCDICGQTPVVTGVNVSGEVIYDSEMCGVCTFGTAQALDPDWWNGDDECD